MISEIATGSEAFNIETSAKKDQDSFKSKKELDIYKDMSIPRVLPMGLGTQNKYPSTQLTKNKGF